jgi:hypothetical protein
MSDQKDKNIDCYNDFIFNSLDLNMRYILDLMYIFICNI